jgi:FkbM family methyltransferase
VCSSLQRATSGEQHGRGTHNLKDAPQTADNQTERLGLRRRFAWSAKAQPTGEAVKPGKLLSQGRQMPDSSKRDWPTCADGGAKAVGTACLPEAGRQEREGTGRPRLVICAGMPRAGSTLQYNLVRLLTEQYLGGRAGGWQESYEAFAERFPKYASPEGDDQAPLVIKVHEFDARFARLVDPPGRGRVFYIYRDLRDALVSSTRQFGYPLDDSIAARAQHWIECGEQWCSLIQVTISRYEYLMLETEREVRRYARALGLELAEEHVGKIVEACSVSRMRSRASKLEGGGPGCYDQEYLVHPRHVADGRWGRWQREMAPAQRRAVRKAAGCWLDERRYPVHEQPSTEDIPHGLAAIPPIDAAPSGVPKLRGRSDPTVVAFCERLESHKSAEPGPRRSPSRLAEVFFGRTLHVLEDEIVSDELVRCGYFEEGLTWALIQCLRPGDVFLDVGAHVGYFTTLAAHLVGAGGHVEAFEPSPGTARLLRKNVERQSHVRVNELVVFSRSGSVILHDYGPHWAVFNSLGPPRLEGREALAASTELTVQAVTLDDFCRDRGLPPAFIKIGAESAELDVLRGAARILAEHQPIIAVEVGDVGVTGAPHSRDILEFAAEFGYQPYEYVPTGRFIPHVPLGWYAYDNLLLLPPSRCRARRDGGRSAPDTEHLLYYALRRQAEMDLEHRDVQRGLRKRIAHLEGLHRKQRHVSGRLHRLYLCMVWQRLRERYATVALFGAGRFARWFLEQVASACTGPRIVRVLDDTAADGDMLGSIPVVRPEVSSLSGVDAVVVATDVPDSPLYQRSKEVCESLPLLNLYEQLDDLGPFPKEVDSALLQYAG